MAEGLQWEAIPPIYVRKGTAGNIYRNIKQYLNSTVGVEVWADLSADSGLALYATTDVVSSEGTAIDGTLDNPDNPLSDSDLPYRVTNDIQFSIEGEDVAPNTTCILLTAVRGVGENQEIARSVIEVIATLSTASGSVDPTEVETPLTPRPPDTPLTPRPPDEPRDPDTPRPPDEPREPYTPRPPDTPLTPRPPDEPREPVHAPSA